MGQSYKNQFLTPLQPCNSGSRSHAWLSNDQLRPADVFCLAGVTRRTLVGNMLHLGDFTQMCSWLVFLKEHGDPVAASTPERQLSPWPEARPLLAGPCPLRDGCGALSVCPCAPRSPGAARPRPTLRRRPGTSGSPRPCPGFSASFLTLRLRRPLWFMASLSFCEWDVHNCYLCICLSAFSVVTGLDESPGSPYSRPPSAAKTFCFDRAPLDLTPAIGLLGWCHGRLCGGPPQATVQTRNLSGGPMQI